MLSGEAHIQYTNDCVILSYNTMLGNSSASEGYSVLAPPVTAVVFLLNDTNMTIHYFYYKLP